MLPRAASLWLGHPSSRHRHRPGKPIDRRARHGRRTRPPTTRSACTGIPCWQFHADIQGWRSTPRRRCLADNLGKAGFRRRRRLTLSAGRVVGPSRPSRLPRNSGCYADVRQPDQRPGIHPVSRWNHMSLQPGWVVKPRSIGELNPWTLRPLGRMQHPHTHPRRGSGNAPLNPGVSPDCCGGATFTFRHSVDTLDSHAMPWQTEFFGRLTDRRRGWPGLSK